MSTVKACPRFRFKQIKRYDNEPSAKTGKPALRAVRIEAYSTAPGRDNDGAVGAVVVDRHRWLKRSYVSGITVLQSLQHCGIGTALYQEAAKTACGTFRLPLHSDRERSPEADGFWQKQLRKGRATCIAPLENPNADYHDKHLVEHGGKPDGSPREGRSGCEAYKLTCPAPQDLSRRSTRRTSPRTARR